MNGKNETPIFYRPETEISSIGRIVTDDNFAKKFMPDAGCVEIEICPQCYGAGMEIVEGKGARPCTVCRKEKRREKLLREIPPKIKKYGIPDLKTLMPRRDLHPMQEVAEKIYEEQKRFLERVRENPFRGFYLAGMNGCGKTTIAYAVLLNAFENGRQVVALTLSELLEQFQLYTNSSGEEKQRNRPVILPEQLRQDETKYSILLDEVGSPKASEYRGEMFFNFLNAVQNFEHQLIVTSNKKYRDFVEKWNAFDETHGDSIARRLSENAIAMQCFFN